MGTQGNQGTDDPSQDQKRSGFERVGRGIVVAVGFLLHAVTGWVYLISGLAVPAPFLLLLWIVWLVLLAWAIRQCHHPWRVLATPFIAAAFWFAYVQGLGRLLDWTA